MQVPERALPPERSLMHPSLEIEISDTQGHMRVDPAALENLARLVLATHRRERASISIALVDNAAIHAVNRTHLGHDWPTDVISFPLSAPDDLVLAGELVVSAEMAVTRRENSVSLPVMNSPSTWFMGSCTCAASTITKTPIDDSCANMKQSYSLAWAWPIPTTNERCEPPLVVKVRHSLGAGRTPGNVDLRPAGGGPLVDRMSLAWMMAAGLPVLALHLVSIALTKAIQSYSRTLLEGRCAAKGHPERASLVEHWDHKTERATEALAVLTGLLLAALMGLGVGLATFPPSGVVVVVPVLAIGLLGYVVAGVIGKVFAEVIVDVLWPGSSVLRAAAAPLTFGLRQVERLVESLSRRSETLHRPAHLQVEIPVEDDAPDEDTEPELPESARMLLQHAVVLTRTDVGELMTPRSSIVSLPSTVSAAEAAATFRRTGLSRIPVFEESRDDIVGVLYAKDLFARMTEARAPLAVSPRDLVRPVLFVPESKNAYDLLEELRTERTHFAIILDEYGSVAGLVTLEDLLEELVGPIDDEHDIPASPDPVRKLANGRFRGRCDLDPRSLERSPGPAIADGRGVSNHRRPRVPRAGTLASKGRSCPGLWSRIHGRRSLRSYNSPDHDRFGTRRGGRRERAVSSEPVGPEGRKSDLEIAVDALWLLSGSDYRYPSGEMVWG